MLWCVPPPRQGASHPEPASHTRWPHFRGSQGRTRRRPQLQPPGGSRTQPPGPAPDPAPTRFSGPWLPGAGWAGKPLVGAPLASELGAHRLHPQGDRASGAHILR